MARDAGAPSLTVWGPIPGHTTSTLGYPQWVPRQHPQGIPQPPYISPQLFPTPVSGKLTGMLLVWSWDGVILWDGLIPQPAGWHWVSSVPHWQQGGGGVKPGSGQQPLSWGWCWQWDKRRGLCRVRMGWEGSAFPSEDNCC